MTFLKELESLINKHSLENTSNTSDFILAQFLEGCLHHFDVAVQQREGYYNRDPRPSATLIADDKEEEPTAIPPTIGTHCDKEQDETNT